MGQIFINLVFLMIMQLDKALIINKYMYIAFRTQNIDTIIYIYIMCVYILLLSIAGIIKLYALFI